MWTPDSNRYSSLKYKRCGKSGVLLPPFSLGFWHNFSEIDDQSEIQKMLYHAVDNGVVHFDLANNYGPPPGSAEETLGRFLKSDFHSIRDELFIATKAGWDMWQGPYGNWGSRKHLVASLDQSLKRMNLDYVDLYYHHRPDPNTPLEETFSALKDMLAQGKCLYVGISAYSVEETRKAIELSNDMGFPLLAHQMSYSMLNREPEQGLFELLDEQGVGAVAFAPLFQGVLSGKYQTLIPDGSRAARDSGNLQAGGISDSMRKIVSGLSEVAQQRGEPLAQMALAWILSQYPTTTLLGVRTLEQLQKNLKALESAPFSKEELDTIHQICG